MKRLFMATLIAGSLFFMPAAEAAIEIYIGEGSATMSEAETQDAAIDRAKLKALRNAQEQAGVYIKNQSRMRDLELVEDEVEMISGGIVKISKTDIRKSLSDDGVIQVFVTVTVQIDTDALQREIERLLNKRKPKEEPKPPVDRPKPLDEPKPKPVEKPKPKPEEKPKPVEPVEPVDKPEEKPVAQPKPEPVTKPKPDPVIKPKPEPAPPVEKPKPEPKPEPVEKPKPPVEEQKPKPIEPPAPIKPIEPPTPVEPVTPPPTEPKPNLWNTDQKDLGTELMEMINAERAKVGKKALTRNSVLAKGAKVRAEELTKKWSDKRPNGTGWWTVLPPSFQQKSSWEYVHSGYDTPQKVIDWYLEQSGSKILSGDYTTIGVGYIYKEDSEEKHYWVVILSN